MIEHRLMTLKEKLAINMKVIELEKAGKEAEAQALNRTKPLPPYLAKILKEKVGADFLINGGWNLLEAEAKYGKDWLNR
ncbi:MAG: hypothetical protein LBS82_03945 [Spirochaetaceae bacterium]|nr:hypothetical protein [Spirochaetaceae bacterium]